MNPTGHERDSVTLRPSIAVVLACAWPALLLANTCLLAFLNKAFLIDDPHFLAMARQILKALTVIEVAPVLKAAGIDTHTDSIKDGLVRVDELIDENTQRLMNEGLVGIDPEITAIWQELQRERDRTRFLDLRFV